MPVKLGVQIKMKTYKRLIHYSKKQMHELTSGYGGRASHTHSLECTLNSVIGMPPTDVFLKSKNYFLNNALQFQNVIRPDMLSTAPTPPQ